MKKAFAFLVAVLLFGALSFAAQEQATTTTKTTKTTKTTHAKAEHVKVASGSVVSASDTELVLSHKMKGKEENVTYKLNPDTKKEGDLAAGNHATVHYKVEGTDNVATMVKASAPKAHKASKAKKGEAAGSPQSK